MLHESYTNVLPDDVYHIVSLSSGASSAVAADRVLKRFGKANTELVFADTQIEDEDNYRFLDDLSKRWQMPITRIVEGRTPLQVGVDEHIIPNQKIHPCTHVLKVVPMQDYCKGIQRDGYRVVMHIGMNLKDAKPRADKPRGRLDAPRKKWGALGIWVEYPVLWPTPIWDTEAEVKAWGIRLPRMYQQGYSHANCGGMCVAQGQGDWRRTLTNYPERFTRAERWEGQMRDDARFADYGFLRDASGGEVSAKTLEHLRLEHRLAVKQRQQPRLFEMLDDMSSTCGVECGVGSESEAA